MSVIAIQRVALLRAATAPLSRSRCGRGQLEVADIPRQQRRLEVECGRGDEGVRDVERAAPITGLGAPDPCAHATSTVQAGRTRGTAATVRSGRARTARPDQTSAAVTSQIISVVAHLIERVETLGRGRERRGGGRSGTRNPAGTATISVRLPRDRCVARRPSRTHSTTDLGRREQRMVLAVQMPAVAAIASRQAVPLDLGARAPRRHTGCGRAARRNRSMSLTSSSGSIRFVRTFMRTP